MSSCSSPDISFEHFNPQFELDANGKSIRPRKKPGRKPNPPSPAQRKAQNRAAQRAFRERKRREMKEAEATVKHCLFIRDQALCESRRLRNKLEELDYENKYLKGQLLVHKIACFANKVDVPKLWDIGNQDGTDKYDTIAQSRTKGIPQPMEIFLDKDKNIINLTQQNKAMDTSNVDPQPTNSFVCTPSSTLHQYDHLLTQSAFLSTMPVGSTDLSLVAPITKPTTVDDLMLDLDSNHWLQQQDLHPNHLAAITQAMTNDNPQGNSQDTLENIKQEDSGKTTDTVTELDVDPKTGLRRIKSTVDEGDDHSTVTPLTLLASQLQYAPPMKPLEALEYIRTVKKQDHEARSVLKPTELQRAIAHDPRIDYVPGPMIRDLMILFQDFYDANELFALLVDSSHFIGGDLRNPDCWNVSPSYLQKYWFLCPSHRPQRADDLVEMAVELGLDMIKMMMDRKAMYFERNRFTDHFPSDSTSHYQQKQHKCQQTQQQYDHEQLYGKDKMVFDTFSGYDFTSSDNILSFIDDTDLFISL